MRKIALLSFYVTLLFAAAASAFALDFSRFNHLVVFGDSLSDNGNLFAITEAKGITPQPPLPYGETFDGSGLIFPGRFTDGQNWVDYFPSVPSVANHLPPNHFPTVTAFYSENHGTDTKNGAARFCQRDSTDHEICSAAGRRSVATDFAHQALPHLALD